MDSLQYLHVFAILLLSGDRFWATKGDEVLMAGPSCQLRQYNFTAEMKTGQGMSCRRFVTTVGCMGVCETFEMDTGDGVLAEESVCQVDDFGEKRIMLDECYGGSQPQTYIYREALSCICQRCDDTQSACLSGMDERKRRNDIS